MAVENQLISKFKNHLKFLGPDWALGRKGN